MKARYDLTAEYSSRLREGGRQPPPLRSAHWLTHVRLVWSRSAAMEMRVTLVRVRARVRVRVRMRVRVRVRVRV